jgi:hypothetical protein
MAFGIIRLDPLPRKTVPLRYFDCSPPRGKTCPVQRGLLGLGIGLSLLTRAH